MVKNNIDYIGILKYLEENSGKKYKDPKKAETKEQEQYFKELKSKAQQAVKEIKAIVSLCSDEYDLVQKNGQIKWLRSSNDQLRNYLWVQMKHEKFETSLISISIFVEQNPTNNKARFRISLEIKSEDADKEQLALYNQHLNKEIPLGSQLVYVRGSNELNNVKQIDENVVEIKSKLRKGEYDKVQLSRIIEQKPYMGAKDYEKGILEAVGEILPYYEYVLGIKEYNRIVFGAPGTGKSYRLKKDIQKLLNLGGDFERVTFHPDYSYANFVGTYKPTMNGNDISYKYVPGPFMRVYKEALNNPREPHVLVIEEINRANVAAVFGDIFQLLDRDENGLSEYPIEASEDIKQYLKNELKEDKDYTKIALPNNMFIWATMNSADQGVFPMDTAFKRRWNFEYLGIDDGQDKMEHCEVTLGRDEYKTIVEWNELRKAINKLLTSYSLNEDKLMGPFFLSQKLLRDTTPERSDKFIEIFKSKVIMYLFEDAARQKRSKLFNGENRYSEICEKFDSKGIYVFDDEISNILGVQK